MPIKQKTIDLAKKLVKEQFPEGRAKEILRATYLRIKYNQIWARKEIKNVAGGYEITLTQKPLDGLKIFFPKIQINYALAVFGETHGYFPPFINRNMKLCVDAGPFPGDTTIAMAYLFPHAQILACEPDPENLAYVKMMIKANGLKDRVEITPFALWKDHQHMEMSQGGPCSGISGLVKTNTKGKIITVETKSIDELTKNYHGQRAFVKMDIEGAELAAMKGAQQTIANGTTFAIAAYHVVDGEETASTLTSLFRQYDYQITLRNLPHLTLIAEPITKSIKRK